MDAPPDGDGHRRRRDRREGPQVSGGDQAPPTGKPRLLGDNGPRHISGDIAKWLKGRHIQRSRGAPCHPQTQGKIERRHQAMKDQILLDNYAKPTNLERQIGNFVERYNNARPHESLQNLTPSGVCSGLVRRSPESSRTQPTRGSDSQPEGILRFCDVPSNAAVWPPSADVGQ